MKDHEHLNSYIKNAVEEPESHKAQEEEEELKALADLLGEGL